MIQGGLVSASFRALAPGEIVDLVAQAGLAGIEWGGDVHVPHGDVACAREVYRRTVDAGLTVCSYGSYYRAGTGEPCARPRSRSGRGSNHRCSNGTKWNYLGTGIHFSIAGAKTSLRIDDWQHAARF